MTDDLRTDRIDEAVLALLSQHLRAFALWRCECVEVLEPGCDGQASRKRSHLRSGDEGEISWSERRGPGPGRSCLQSAVQGRWLTGRGRRSHAD